MPRQAIPDRASAALPAPGPWTLAERGKAGSHGITNLYVLDANGRTIMAVWGKPGEREATARLVIAASPKATKQGAFNANNPE